MKNALIKTICMVIGVLYAGDILAETQFSAEGNYYRINPDGTSVSVTRSEATDAPSSNGNIPLIVEYDGIMYPVSRIGQNAFAGNTGLVSATIPESVKYIDAKAFQGCVNLKAVYIKGASLRRIGKWAFSLCRSLYAINLPSTVMSIGEYAFSDCSSLVEIKLPENVTTISDGLFRACPQLKDAHLSHTVTTIGSAAFMGCKKLTVVPIFQLVTEIGAEAFAECESLEGISIFGPAWIRECAFMGATNLTDVELGEEIKGISFAAFSGCDRLEYVSCAAITPPEANGSAFSASDLKNATLSVPEESIDSYKNCLPWSAFGKIEKLPIFTEIIIVEDE